VELTFCFLGRANRRKGKTYKELKPDPIEGEEGRERKEEPEIVSTTTGW